MENNKKKINPLFAFILGIFLAAGTVYAYSYFADTIGFTSNKGLRSTNVQDAIDEVYADVVRLDDLKKKTDRIDFVSSKDITEIDSWIFSQGLTYEFARTGKTTRLTITIPSDYDFTQPCHDYLASQTNCIAFEIPNNNNKANFRPVQSQMTYTAQIYSGAAPMSGSGVPGGPTINLRFTDASGDHIFPAYGERWGFFIDFNGTPTSSFGSDITISFDFVNKSEY